MRLDGVKQTGSDRWIARCPAHDDRSPSLSIRETSDGTILLKDFGGCSAADIVQAVGLEMSDLFPRKLSHHKPTERRPFPAADVLACLYREALIVQQCARALLDGQKFTECDQRRLALAVARIEDAASYARR